MAEEKEKSVLEIIRELAEALRGAFGDVLFFDN